MFAAATRKWSPRPTSTLEFGDLLVAAVPAGKQAEVRRHFGDSIKGNAELSFVSIGVGIALGLLLGMIPIPLPGGGSFSLGVAGGPLVMALVLGWLGRTGPIGWRMPVVANLVLRNLGLSVFIGSVAHRGGRRPSCRPSRPTASRSSSAAPPCCSHWC